MKIMLKMVLYGVVLYPFATASSFAEGMADMSLEELMNVEINIATGTKQPLFQAPAVASVITAQDIKNMGATTLDEVLEHIPGMHISLAPINLNSIYSIRGIHADFNPQVLLTINGIPFQNNYSGSRFDKFRLSVANIARVEVIRGPLSALHGADAFAGTINVITKTADDIKGLQTGLQIGSFDSLGAWLQYGTQLQNWKVAFNIEHQSSDGDDARRVSRDFATSIAAPSLAGSYPLQTRHNILNTTLALSNTNWTINLGHWQERDGGTGVGLISAIDPRGSVETDVSQVDLSYNFPQKLAGWQLNSRANWMQGTVAGTFQMLPPDSTVPIGEDGNLFTPSNASCTTPLPGVAWPVCLANYPQGMHGNPTGKNTSKGLDLIAMYEQIPKHVIRASVGLSRHEVITSETKNYGPGTPASLVGDRAADIPSPPAPAPIWVIPGTLTDTSNTPFVFMASKKRSHWYAALQDEWKINPDWAFTGGLRHDHYSDFGNTLNPRAALVWNINPQLSSKLLYGSAFRAPSFFELYTQNNPAILGNSKLKPEKIQNTELAFNYRPSPNQVHALNTYYYRAKDIIAYTSTTIGKQADNLYSQKGYGLELESKWQITPALQLAGSYAWQHSRDASNHAIPDAPSSELFASILWQPGNNWSLYSSATHIMDRKRRSSDTRQNISDYTLVNLTARKQLTQEFELVGMVRNLFDEDAREPSDGKIPEDYPLESRSVMLEIRYQMPTRK